MLTEPRVFKQYRLIPIRSSTKLISAFAEETGVPAVLNTSLNARGEPIVEAPIDALRTFNGTGLDAIFLGDCILEKPASPRP